MNPGITELLQQGLIMTALGMGLVFAALALLWGLITLLTRALADRAPVGRDEIPHVPARPGSAGRAGDTSEVPGTWGIFRTDAHADTKLEGPDALTAERARVAALVAGALLAGALPLPVEVPLGPTFEHGRSAPCWVTTNRARALRPWQPPRPAEN